MRYLVFEFGQYYPCGGAHDLKLATNDLVEACEKVEELINPEDWCDSSEAHVYDTHKGEIIFTKSS